MDTSARNTLLGDREAKLPIPGAQVSRLQSQEQYVRRKCFCRRWGAGIQTWGHPELQSPCSKGWPNFLLQLSWYSRSQTPKQTLNPEPRKLHTYCAGGSSVESMSAWSTVLELDQSMDYLSMSSKAAIKKCGNGQTDLGSGAQGENYLAITMAPMYGAYCELRSSLWALIEKARLRVWGGGRGSLGPRMKQQ